jgi:hypothetical protein
LNYLKLDEKLPDDFGGTDVDVDPVFTIGQEFDGPRLSESLAIHFTKNGLVIRLLVQTQRQSEGPHVDGYRFIKINSP